MKTPMPFMKDEEGFTTPAAALAILVVCALVFVSARGIAIGARSGQIQYVADAGALAADNTVAEFITIGQTVDASLLSMSLLALTVYGVSAVAAFIPGGQGAAAEFAQIGAKVFQARDKFAESAIKGLDTAQKALPAICAVRSAQAVQANADATGIAYTGFALTCPVEGVHIELSDDASIEKAAHEIESKEDEIQQKSLEQQNAQMREDEAKRRAWLADCGNDGMSMYERARKLSGISETANPYFSSPDYWSFSVPINRACAYYQARYYAEPGSRARGSAETVGESVARKRFYAYARTEVSKGYIETTGSGAKIPHLMMLARNTEQIRGTFLYTESIYPVSDNEGKLYLHAYSGCPTYRKGAANGSASVRDIDAGQVGKCPQCNYSATTLGRVPSASTSIDNGFEYYYAAVVKASQDYAEAVKDGEDAKRSLNEERDAISELLEQAVKELGGKRYEPQPPGRYGCICIVIAPSARLRDVPFLNDNASIPARIAISGATLAPDPQSDAGNIISDIASGLVPQEALGSGIVKTVFSAWGTMLDVYTNGVNGIETGFKKVLGGIPLIGTTISDQAVTAFKNALNAANLQPADLTTYKPALVNTSYILARDNGKAAEVLSRLKQAASIQAAISVHDMDALVKDIQEVPEVKGLLDEHGLEIASIDLGGLGLGTGERKLYLPVPKDLAEQMEQIGSLFPES